MAGAVCHELTNPMQVVLTASHELTRRPSHLAPRESELCDLIKKSIQEMSKTTRNLTRITKYATMNYIQGKKIKEMILLGSKRRLNDKDFTAEERDRLMTEIQALEAEMGME